MDSGRWKVTQKRVLEVLGRFVPIRAVRIAPADPRLVSFAQRLVLDEEAYKRYLFAPEEQIKAIGVDVETIDVKRLTAVVDQLRARAAGLDSVFDPVATEQQHKETEQATFWNFDRSSGSTTQYESHSSYDKGYTSQTSTSEGTYTNKTFASSGIGRDPESMLIHELKFLFYPGQPLVTPGLIEKIRSAIARGRR